MELFLSLIEAEVEISKLTQFGINIALCFFGLMGYTLWSVRNHIGVFNFRKFWYGNINFWVWAILVQILYASLMAFIPELEHWITNKLIALLETAVGQKLNIPETLAKTVVYLTLTWQLSRIANKTVSDKNKIGTKKEN